MPSLGAGSELFPVSKGAANVEFDDHVVRRAVLRICGVAIEGEQAVAVSGGRRRAVERAFVV
jgi:hypothetical protein